MDGNKKMEFFFYKMLTISEVLERKTGTKYLRTTSFFESHSQKIFDKVGGCVSGRTRTNSTPTPCCNMQTISNEDYARGISYNAAPASRFFSHAC